MLIGAGAASGAAASLSEQAFEWKFEGRETFDTGELVSATVIGGVLGPAGKIVGGWGRRALGKFFPGLLPKGIIGADPLIQLPADATAEQALAAVAKTEQTLFNFTKTAAAHMDEVGRMIPVQILDDVIKAPMAVVKDPRGATNAIMHYSQMWKNGKLYNVEVLYDKASNTIMHFKYDPRSLGPLPAIK